MLAPQVQLPPARHVERALDAHRVVPGLYQGSRPPEGQVLRRLGFTMLLLCAMEHQPPDENFPGVAVFRAPLDDDARPLTRAEWEAVRNASRAAAFGLRAGRRVLVTCYSGFNRSGLVTALTLLRVTPPSVLSAEDAVRLVQRRRPGALLNAHFIDAVLSVERRRR